MYKYVSLSSVKPCFLILVERERAVHCMFVMHTHTHTHTHTTSLYISVQGYKHRRGFITAQAPMKSTCRDFWKMVYERECGVIVMLSDLVENGEVGRTELQRFPILLFSIAAAFLSQEVCYQYWPSDDTKGMQKYGEFTVSILQTTKENGFIQRNMSITNPKV